MNYFGELVTPAAHLPVTVDAADQKLAAAVVEELERVFLWRAIVRQERRVVIHGPLPPMIEMEPVTAITSLTRWTPSDPAAVIDADTYYFVSTDPAGCIIEPVADWPAPERPHGSFAINYSCGFVVTPETAANAGDAVNKVPAAIRLMVSRAVEFRSGSGLAGFTIGSLKINIPPSYSTDKLPPEIASIGAAYAYRPGIFAARP